MDKKHIFVSKLEDLLIFVKESLETTSDESKVAIKRFESYKMCANISNKTDEVESQHYHLFKPMVEKICQLYSSNELDHPDWLSEKNTAYHVMFINKKQEAVKELSIDFSSIYSQFVDMDIKMYYISKVISLLILTCNDAKNRSKLASYAKYIADMIDEFSEDEEEESEGFNQMFDKMETMFTDKKMLGKMVTRFGGMYNKIKSSDVGEAISNSIPEGNDLTAESIKNTLANVSNKLSLDENKS